MRLLLLGIFVAGCGAAEAEPVEQAASLPVIQYNVNAPYQISGASASGSDGLVYSVLPSAPLATDPWRLTFCYQSYCFTLTMPLDYVPTGEVQYIKTGDPTLTASGDLACSTWKNTATVTWYDATPTHWHIAINALCIDSSFAISGDWRRIN